MRSAGIGSDIRHALRILARRPAVTAIVLVSLALGIGANSAIFTLAHAVLFEELPYADDHRLVRLHETFRHAGGEGYGSLSVPNLEDWRAQAETLEAMSAYTYGSFNLLESGAEIAERILGLQAEHDLLELLGVPPVLGRVFQPEERNVVVLSHDFWQERFGGSGDVVGTVLRLNEAPMEVIGVMPEGFRFPHHADVRLYAPLHFPENLRDNRGNHSYPVIARLAPGVDKEQSQAELDRITAAIATEHPDSQEGRGARVETLREPTLRSSGTALAMLAGAVGLVLLITCANVTNLLLAQASRRRRELRIRSALGADRGRLVRQMLVETQVLSLAGGVLGAVLGAALLAGLARLPGSGLGIGRDLALDVRVVLFSIAVAALTTLLCGWLPALRWSRPGAGAGLASRGESRDALRSGLVVAEVALAVVVLVTAGLTVRSLQQLSRVDPGLDPENLLTFAVSLGSSYDSQEKMETYWNELVSRVGAQPSVESVGLTTHVPLRNWGFNGDFLIVGQTNDDESRLPFSERRLVSPGYFSTVGVPLLRGETFHGKQGEEWTPEVLINDALARRYFPGEDPVGRHVSFDRDGEDESQWLIVRGVVGDVHMAGLDRDPLPTIYVPLLVDPRAEMHVVLRSHTDLDTAMTETRAALASIDPNQAPFAVRSFEEVLRGSSARRSFSTRLLSGFGILALVLALAGVGGVLWYGASLRRREIAVRVAVGATRDRIVRGLVLDGLGPAALGVALGLVASAAIVRSIRSQLYEVSVLDPGTYIGVTVLLLGTAVLAALIPAWRASGTSPGLLLRD